MSTILLPGPTHPRHQTTTTELATELTAIVGTISIDTTLTSGRVVGQDVEAEDPRAFRHLLARQIYTTLHAGIVGQPPRPTSLSRRGDRDIQHAIDQATSLCPTRDQRITHWSPAPGLDHRPGAIALIDQLRVFVPQDRYRTDDDGSLLVRRNTVAHRLSVGFSFFTSPAGSGESDGELLRLYRHATTPEELLTVWRRIVAWTVATNCPLRMKMLSERAFYPRNDAMVVYLPPQAWEHRHDLAAIMASGDPNARISPFVSPLAPGVGWAWEPQDPTPGASSKSFGEHRSAALAEGLWQATHDGVDWHAPLIDRLRASNIDPVNPGRNLTSPRLEEPC